MFEQGLIIAHHSYNLIENSFKDGFRYYCKKNHTIDYLKLSAEKGTNHAEKKILALIETQKIEVILSIQPISLVHLNPLFLKEISQNALIISVFLDLELYFESIDRYYAQCSDLVLIVGSKEYKALFSLYQIESCHTASLYDSKVYKNNFLDRTIDVLFIGDITRPNRKEYINFIEKKGINVISVGKGTKRGFVTNEKMIELYNSAKITLNFSGTHNNPKNIPYTKNINSKIAQIKGRITEASLCGSFILTEDTEPKEDRYCLSKHIDTFKNKRDLFNKIEFYLKNNQIREEKAHNAYLHSIDNYDAVKGMHKPMSIVKNTNKKNNKIELDKDFTKIYTTHHFFMFLDFVMSKNIKHSLHELNILYKYNFNIRLGKETFSYIKELLISRYYLYKSRKIKKDLLSILKKPEISSFVIYAGGLHTQNLIKQFNNEIKNKITVIYDQNKLLENKKIEDISITSSKEILKNAKNILISSFTFEQEIIDVLQKDYPKTNIIRIYKKSKKDLFFTPSWYEIFFSSINK
ncbi:MAG: glycosyltransferase family 1 protein [Colwellia sp.]|nr:glycosyltransferase family 1 protein [Colwellia sp.]